MRLAAVLLDQKDYAGAMQLLEARHAKAFDALFDNLRGDVLVAQGKMDEARAAYRKAMDELAPKSPLKTVVQIKLDSVGG